MTPSEFKRTFPPRKPDSHKGDFGKILILAGSRGFPGAPCLAGLGALRAGAGLITIAVPKSLYAVMALKLTEVMVKPLPETGDGTLSLSGAAEITDFLSGQDVLALGPGLSQNLETQELIQKIVGGCRKPMVIDADGLNAFGKNAVFFHSLKNPVILTPHPGEAARLFGAPVPGDVPGRKNYAMKMAKCYGVYLVLKGHGTVVAAPDGKIYVNNTGNPGLATGGSGDLLTGIIAAFLGQGLTPFEAARCAVYIHGLAGDLALQEFGEISLTPTDVLNYLPKAFKKVLKR